MNRPLRNVTATFLERVVVAAVILTASVVHADKPPEGALTGIVADGERRPIPGATVILSGVERPGVLATRTNAEGIYELRGVPAGEYALMVVFGDVRSVTKGVQIEDGLLELNPTLIVEAEVITIREPMPPPSLPKPIEKTVTKILPWSDDVILGNHWSVGWLLLDIDPSGKVSGFRFLRRPGRGLDEIAEKEAWKLRFEPSRDAAGRAVVSQLLWKMEWPAYWWYQAVRQPGDPLLPRGMPPCRGYGPLNLGSVNHTYRDCSTPDVSSLLTEKMITRPSGS